MSEMTIDQEEKPMLADAFQNMPVTCKSHFSKMIPEMKTETPRKHVTRNNDECRDNQEETSFLIKDVKQSASGDISLTITREGLEKIEVNLEGIQMAAEFLVKGEHQSALYMFLRLTKKARSLKETHSFLSPTSA